jgi:hypothetical protein
MAGSVFIVDLQKLQWRDERGNEQTKERVYSPDMGELVGVRQVLAIPRSKKVAPVMGRKGEVQRIADRVPWHDSAGNVRLHNLEDGWLDSKKRQRCNEAKAFLAIREVTTFEFIGPCGILQANGPGHVPLYNGLCV